MIVGAAAPAGIGRATARFTIASTLGRSSGTLAAGVLIAAIGASGLIMPVLPATWRALFLMTALPNVVLLAVITRAGAGGEATRLARTVTEPDPARAGWRSYASTFLIATAPVILIQSVGAWMPTVLVRDNGLSVARAATLVGLATLIATSAGQLIGGRLLDRHPRLAQRPALLIVPALAIAAASLAWVIASPRLIVAVGAVALIDLLCGIAALAGLASLQSLAPAASRGRANSLFFALVTILGVGVGPLLVGVLSDAGHADAASLAHALGWVGLATLAVAAAGHLLGRAPMAYRTGASVPHQRRETAREDQREPSRL